MLHLPALFTALALAGAPTPAPDEATLWKAAFALDGSPPAVLADAESKLLQAGTTAYDILTKLARVGGRAQAVSAAGPVPFCMSSPQFRVMSGMRSNGGPRLPGKAAELAGRLLMKDEALRRRAQTSVEPFDRALALLSTARSPEAQAQALAAMRKEPDAELRLWASAAATCFVRSAERRGDSSLDAMRIEEKHLAELAEDVGEPLRCVEPAELAPTLVDELAGGMATAGGWSSSNDSFQLDAERANGERVFLSPACALAAYDAVAARGTYIESLVMPLATHLRKGQDLRKAAGERAARDLKHYPELRRNHLAAELVNAGHTVSTKVTWKEDRGFNSRDELEAALRQGNPDAKAALDRMLFCRSKIGENELSLLGYLGTKQAAETAYGIAQRCPDSVAAATAALVRLKDPRASQFLPKALENWGFDQEALRRSLVEAYTSKLGQQLKDLEAKGNDKARDMVEFLKDSGVMKP
ncbi:hypothetical protein OV208_08890 [Corallococcus sp. bb12-1]|uniref:hypothetical protein n=1 Tax=Corallococcus sp. bb12-1 TaxID=2996784 RepID=UPI00226FA81D|nr:hypothetical protein [Corallococcus sp. bb12-1]MCY1041429.1 hypothetical protein [Corallococcus sp. bb12-1]